MRSAFVASHLFCARAALLAESFSKSQIANLKSHDRSQIRLSTTHQAPRLHICSRTHPGCLSRDESGHFRRDRFGSAALVAFSPIESVGDDVQLLPQSRR